MSGTDRGPFELSAGCRLVLAGTQWQVDWFEPHTGRVLLRRDDGQELSTTVRALVNHGDCRPALSAAASTSCSRGRQPAGLEDLTARQRELVAMRYAHLMEAETGYRSGSLQVPAELDGIIVAVLGLDNRPQAAPHFRLASTALP